MSDSIQKTFAVNLETQPTSTSTNKTPALSPQKMMAGNSYTGQPYIIAQQNGLAMVGDQKHVITVSPELGVTISGPMSLSAMPQQISFGGGYWTLNPLNLSMLPSSAVTPVPMFKSATPKLIRASSGLSGIVGAAEGAVGL